MTNDVLLRAPCAVGDGAGPGPGDSTVRDFRVGRAASAGALGRSSSPGPRGYSMTTRTIQDFPSLRRRAKRHLESSRSVVASDLVNDRRRLRICSLAGYRAGHRQATWGPGRGHGPWSSHPSRPASAVGGDVAGPIATRFGPRTCCCACWRYGFGLLTLDDPALPDLVPARDLPAAVAAVHQRRAAAAMTLACGIRASGGRRTSRRVLWSATTLGSAWHPGRLPARRGIRWRSGFLLGGGATASACSSCWACPRAWQFQSQPQPRRPRYRRS